MGLIDFFWLVLIAFAFASFLVVLFGVVADVFRDHDLGGGAKALWILLLILFPLITALVYLLVRGSGMGRRQQAELNRTRTDADTYIREVAGRSPAGEIASAKSLLDAGTITDDEFRVLKDHALGRGTARHAAVTGSTPTGDSRPTGGSRPTGDDAASTHGSASGDGDGDGANRDKVLT